MTSRPSSPSTPRSDRDGRRRTEADGDKSNAPSTTVFSAPGRTTSAEARSPSSSASASTTIDFPAPVSPVRTLRPGWNGRVTSAMTARPRPRNSVSTSSPPAPLSLRARGNSLSSPIAEIAPVQLLPQPLEEALRAEPHQENGPFGATHLEALARLNRRADLAIEGDEN